MNGENIITILVKNSETNKNSTYQIIVNKSSNDNNVKTTENLSMKKAKKIKTIAVSIVSLIIIFAIIFFVLKYKKSKAGIAEDDREYDEDEEDYDDEETINLEKEEELFRRVNKAKFKPVEEVNLEEDLQKTNKSVTESNETVEDYFKSLEEKQKGKHF